MGSLAVIVLRYNTGNSARLDYYRCSVCWEELLKNVLCPLHFRGVIARQVSGWVKHMPNRPEPSREPAKACVPLWSISERLKPEHEVGIEKLNRNSARY